MWSHFRNIVGKYPKTANVFIYAGLFIGGELTQQTFQGKEKYDWSSVLRVSSVGGCLGPVNHIWYIYLDRFLPGHTGRVLVKKVLIDQGLMGAFGSSVFFTGTAALEGKSFEEIKRDVIYKWPKAYLTGWVFWPPVQLINFRYLPTNMRAPYVAAGAFIWTNVLCFIRSLKVDKPVAPSNQDNSDEL